MTKNNWLLIGALVVLSAIYAYYFTDWFKPKFIEIYHTSRRIPRLTRAGVSPETVPVEFGLTGRYHLTEVKVVPLLTWQTNHNCMAVWHLISDSNSILVKAFSYGQRIPGLRPALPGTHAEPLDPGVTYHLMVASGKLKGEHDFEAEPAEPPSSQ